MIFYHSNLSRIKKIINRYEVLCHVTLFSKFTVAFLQWREYNLFVFPQLWCNPPFVFSVILSLWGSSWYCPFGSLFSEAKATDKAMKREEFSEGSRLLTWSGVKNAFLVSILGGRKRLDLPRAACTWYRIGKVGSPAIRPATSAPPFDPMPLRWKFKLKCREGGLACHPTGDTSATLWFNAFAVEIQTKMPGRWARLPSDRRHQRYPLIQCLCGGNSN